MDLVRLQKAEKIFYGALPRPHSEWSSFVTSHCAGDTELAAYVMELLECDAKGSFLDTDMFELGARVIAFADTLEVGRTLGKYKIKRIIGRGGMGTVYLADDITLDRGVALKVIPPTVAADSVLIGNFRREAQAASKITHPNIAHVYEFGSDGGTHYVAMEYIPGKTLREVLNEGPIDPAAGEHYISQITSALAAAHNAGVVHGDVKPENFIVGEDNIIKVLDFGLARITRSDGRESISGVPAGTIDYMSPEQMLGGSSSPQSDVWSLGVLCFEIINGTRPFIGKTKEEIQASVIKDPPLPSGSRTERATAEIVAKCLEKSPANRFASAAEMHARVVEVEASAAALSARSNSRRRIWLTVGSVAALGLFAFVWWQFFALHDSLIDSVAVLPFKNESGRTDREFLAEGLTESLINRLSKLPHLTVKPSSAVMRYKGRDADIQQIGEELNVESVLYGRITSQGDDLQLHLSMIDTRSGNQLWGETYNRKTSDIIGLQNQVAVDVSQKLQQQLTGPDKQNLAKSYTSNPQANFQYMLGRFHWNKRSGEDIRKSIDHFQNAVKLDPKFALAYAGLAETYVISSGYTGIPPQEAFALAKEAANKAIALDEQIPEAHTALGYALFNYDWNFDESEKQFNRALELNPNYSTAHHWYGNGNLLATGRFDESIEALKRAKALDPQSLIISADLGTSYLYAGRYDDAISQFNETLRMDANFYYANVYLARTFVLKGDPASALASLDNAAKFGMDPRIPMLRCLAYEKMGQRDDAERQLDELKALGRKRYVSNFEYALISAGFGDFDNAIESLEKAYTAHDSNLIYMKTDPLLAGLRQDPRFINIAKRVGLE
ncbi:MAG: protein kinase [Pyrinomonadaceae bacterium]